MKYFIRHFSLLIVFFILVFGFVIKFHNYEEQKELEYIKIGKYTFDKNYTFTVNDSLIKNKTISEYKDILFKIIKLHRNSKIEVNKMEKIISLKNKFVQFNLKYDLQDSLIFKSTQLYITNLNYCED